MHPKELKKILVSNGFQVFRIVGSRVLLADRVRDNLILESGVAVVSGEQLAVRVVVKAQSRDYPGEEEEQLFERARELGQPAVEHGFSEVETAVVPVQDPGDAARVLDVWHEVTFEKVGISLAELTDELSRVLTLKKIA